MHLINLSQDLVDWCVDDDLVAPSRGAALAPAGSPQLGHDVWMGFVDEVGVGAFGPDRKSVV